MKKAYALDELLPPILFGEELKDKLTSYPEYTDDMRELDAGTRLLKLMDIYRVFVPQSMAMEIYHKLYMMTVMSLKQKESSESIRRLNEGVLFHANYSGIVTGATSCTIIGTSGIGKSSCVQRIVPLLGPVLELGEPVHRVIPAIQISCPFDCNYKGLLCQILISLDEALGTDYYEKCSRRRMNAQQILSQVCNLCRLHIGIIVIDEIQFMMEHKAGKQLYRMILQLINSAGIGVVLVGTNECLEYFEQAPQMARRTAGLRYGNMPYDEAFKELCSRLFSFQYVQEKTVLTEGVIAWLYEHTAGNPANLMAIIHDAQEIAIMNGSEKLDIKNLTDAYSQRMQMLHGHIALEQNRNKPTVHKREREVILQEPECGIEAVDTMDASLSQIVQTVKTMGTDVVNTLRHYVPIEEVAI